MDNQYTITVSGRKMNVIHLSVQWNFSHSMLWLLFSRKLGMVLPLTSLALLLPRLICACLWCLPSLDTS